VEDPVREELAVHLAVDAELQHRHRRRLWSSLGRGHGGAGSEEVTAALGRLLEGERDRLGVQHPTLSQHVEIHPDVLVIRDVADPGEDRQSDGVPGGTVPEPYEMKARSSPRRYRLFEDVHHVGVHRCAGAHLHRA